MKIKPVGDKVEVRLTFWEKFWSLHGDFLIPKSNIVRVIEGKQSWYGCQFRIPGTFVPWVIKAGSYWSRSGWEFWYVTRWSNYVYKIELRGMRYKSLVLGVDSLISDFS